MKRILICLLLTLTMALSAVPMLATTASADEGAPTGGTAAVLTPEDIYVPGATVFLSAFEGENNIVVNGDGTASWTDARTGNTFDLIGNTENVVGTYTCDHITGFNEGALTVANYAQKVHYAEDGTTELYRATLTIYTDPALAPSGYGNFKTVADNGTEVVACRSTIVIEAKDADGNWSSDPALASYVMGGWSLDELGGIGYTLPDFYYSDNIKNLIPLKSHYIELGADALPADEMTFEIVSSITGATDTDGFRTTLSKNTSWEGDGEWRLGFRLGALSIVPRVTSPMSPGCNPGIGKVILAYAKDHAFGMDIRFVNSAATMSGITKGSTIAMTKDKAGTEYTYTVSMQGVEIGSMTTGTTYQYFPNDELISDPFRVAMDLPETVFAIRVYATALSKEQLAQNHFADLARFYGLDLTTFSAMPEAFRQTIYDGFSALDFSQSKDSVQASLEESISAVTYVPEQNQYDRLYVQNGLSILLTAYDLNEGAVSLVNGNGTWQSKIADKNGVYPKFSIVGQTKSFAFTDAAGVIREGDTSWKKIDGAGIGYEATLGQLQGGLSNYIDIGIENLPESHTVEMIFDPYGAYLDGKETYRSDSGIAERWGYIITAGNIGIYSKHMIPKDSGLSVAPHSAFYVAYQTNGSWTANDKKSPGSADSLSLDTLGVINLSVIREEASPKTRTGIVVYDGARTVTSLVNSFDILPSRGSEFKLMRETPGTLYAIRVYDRVLTAAERAQNHFADVCNFYKLDLSDFYNTAILPESYRQEVYDAMLDIDFSLTREKAQDYLTSAVFASLIKFDGFAIQTEGSTEELSAIFTVNNKRIDALLELGYTVTFGGILADADVSFDDMLYDSTEDGVRVFYLFSNDDDITATPVFITETAEKNQFGLSVYYDAVTSPENYGKLYRFRSFALLEKDGEKLVAYVDAKTESLGDAVSHYSAAEHLTMLDDYQDNQKLLSSMDNSFNRYDIFVDADNGNDENSGAKNAPVKSLEKALELALDLINSMAMPEVNVILAGGKYELDETLTLDAESVTADYYRLVFKKQEGEESPTVTGTFDVPGSSFQLYDADKNIYVYPLPESMKDANGLFPSFQNLYVDGKMATLAETDWFIMLHDEYKTPDGYFTVWVPDELLMGVIEKTDDGKYYLAGNHPDTMRWAVRMQWYYYDLVIESIDIGVTNSTTAIPNLQKGDKGFVPPANPYMRSTEGYVALKFYADHGSVYNGSHQSVGTLHGHDYEAKLTGSMAFLDEGGEFYYDQLHGEFYYIPTEEQNVSELTFGIAMLENLIYLDASKNITFDGITFTGTDTKYIPQYGFTGGQAGSQKRSINGSAFIHEGAIVGKNVTNITVKNCTFDELYYHGVDFIGVVNKVTLDSNVFTYLGGGAIQLGSGGYSTTCNNSNIRITNNYLHEIGIIFYNNCAMTITNVKNGKILNNSIIDCAYTGISVGWSWQQTSAPVGTYFNIFNCEIAYNYIENFMFMMYDGGSIYTLGGNAPVEYSDYLNEMHHNYSYCGSTSGHIYCPVTSTALYHDGGSSHWYTHDNVTWVDQETLGHYNYISIQAGEAGGSQAYNILAENNYFINLYQKYLTLGYRRVRDDWNVYEVDSFLLTTLYPEEFEDEYLSVGVTHKVSKNPANWAPFYQSGRVEAMDDIMSFAGCDLFDGIYKGQPLGDFAYDYNYRLLTQSETWYTPERDNPDYADR